MAEPASAVRALIGTGFKAWNTFDTLIKEVNNAPLSLIHWTMVVGLMKNLCLLMKTKLEGLKSDSLTAAQKEFVGSIWEFIRCFDADLKQLTEGLPDADRFYAGNRSFRRDAILLFEQKLRADENVIKRIDRSIQLSQVSASGLSLLEPGPVDRIKETLDQLGRISSGLPSNDENLKEWRNNVQGLLTDAAIRDLLESPDSSNTPSDDSVNTRRPRTEPMAGSLRQLQYQFEAAQNLATRFCEADMPILAMSFQLQAIEFGGELREQQPDYALHFANRVDLAEKYVDIAIACKQQDQMAVDTALERLEMLCSAVLEESLPGTSPRLCDEQRRIGVMFSLLNKPTRAIELFNHALGGYIELSANEYHQQICRTYNLAVAEYQRAGQHVEKKAFRDLVADKLGTEFVFRRSELDRVIKWCKKRGFNVMEEEDLSSDTLTNDRGNTPLHEAVACSEMTVELLSELLRLEQFYEAEDKNGDTPLLAAVSKRDDEVVGALLKKAPYLVHVRDRSGQTPLHRCGQAKTLQLVLDAIKSASESRDESVEESATRPRRREVGIDSKDTFDQTALHLFCERGDHELVKMLVENNANVDAESLGGKTPLMVALKQGWSHKTLDAIIVTLVTHHAKTDIRDKYGKNDVQKALKKRGYTRRKLESLVSPGPTVRPDAGPSFSTPVHQQQSAASRIGSIFKHDKAYAVSDDSVTAPTDSGYASMKLDVGSKLHQLPQDDIDDDACTVYSVDSALPENEMDMYKTELSETILNHIRPLTSDTKLYRMITLALPNLLRSFALRLGCSSLSNEEKGIIDIANRFNEAAQRLPGEQELDSSPKIQDHTLAGYDIRQWAQGIGQEAVADPEKPRNDVADDVADEIEDQPSLVDLRGYRDIIFNSVSYKWLMTEITKGITLAVVEGGDDVCTEMHAKVSACLEQNKSVSSHRPSERYTMRFLIEWNPTEFFHEQFSGDSDMEHLLEDTLTLTGSVTDAQVLPCAEYLRQTWPRTGPDLLNLLKTAFISEQAISGELGDGSTIECSFHKSNLEVLAGGTADSVAMIGEQFGWVAAALRSSSSESGLATCRPQITIDTPPTGPAVCNMRFPVDANLVKGQDSGNGQCWHELFRNPVVVTGYPIPRRTRYGSGLEIQLNVMSGLTECPRINQYLGRHFLKGFSTALVPIEELNDVTLWHLYYSSDGSRLPYPNLETMHNVGRGIRDLAAGRHIVGWCSEAKFFAGSPNMNYAIKPSRLQRPGREFALEKISFSVGQIVTGGCQFAIGRKDAPIRITHGSYRAKLQWIIRKYVTLWDVDEERGWLINGCAALVHLLRMSLESSKLNQLASEFHFQDDKFEESSNPLSLSSALEILLNPNNQKLELDIKEQKSFTETRVLQDGQQETVTKTVTTWTTLRDRVEELYEMLEKLIDHNVASEASYKGINAKLRLQDQLEGWDFTDIATDQGPCYLRKANLPIHLLSWVDFVRQIPAITLFGKGFGDIIRASPTGSGDRAVTCQEWERLPKNHYLLGVSVADLQDIINSIGEQGADSIMVAPGMMWKNPIKGSPFHENCLCLSKGQPPQKHSHHSIQELVSDILRSGACMVDLDNHKNGAVIFGSKPGWKLPWRLLLDVGPAEKESPTESVLLGHSGTPELSSGNDHSSPSQAPNSLGPGDPDHSGLRTSANSRLGTSGQQLTPEAADSGTEPDTFRPPVAQDSEPEGVISPNEVNQDEEIESKRSGRQSWVRRKASLIKKRFRGGW
ncbi:hypothetical protein NM208_g7203 [Fusarium decemcellulare]|uniref:Uncharacterized protein n=1 Tax=Fusarium decemcellulare TaxID=57161 RepID=A0ACC1SA06_9HYPO|nr:hypothetical protein NM208_g7203 [Fusarium decemcellulare]